MTLMAIRKCFSACLLFVLLAGRSEAETILLSSFTNLVPQHASDYPELGGTSVNYSASNVSFTNSNSGQVIVSNPKFSLAYLSLRYVDGNTWGEFVGGLDGVGTSANGWFNLANTNFPGLDIGEGADTSENWDPWFGNWYAFVDLNGNGIYGTIIPVVNGGYLIDQEPGEWMEVVSVFGFQPLQLNVGTLSAGCFSGLYGIPDMSTASIRLDGAAVSTGQSNSFSFAVCTTNLPFFRVECNDSLTNAKWTSMAQYNVTGAVTCVTDTNAVPQRFYRVVAP